MLPTKPGVTWFYFGWGVSMLQIPYLFVGTSSMTIVISGSIKLGNQLSLLTLCYLETDKLYAYIYMYIQLDPT